jgi:tetratricopeptide (TPR) repeat protein
MKLVYTVSILLLALITSAQCQQTAEDWFNKGKDLDNQGKYADAIDAYHEAIIINPELGGVRDFLEAASVKYGEILLDDGNEVQAVASCNEAIKINPDNENAWLCKARAIRSSPYNFGVDDAYEMADKAYGEVIRINPDNADAWYERAHVLWTLEKEDKSAKAYDEVIRINPQHDKAWNAKGEAHDRRGEYDEAVKAFDEAIRLEPDNLEYQENRRKSLAHAAMSRL